MATGQLGRKRVLIPYRRVRNQEVVFLVLFEHYVNINFSGHLRSKQCINEFHMWEFFSV